MSLAPTPTIERPPLDLFDAEHAPMVEQLFERWGAVVRRDRVLTSYYDMKNDLRDLGISIPEGFLHVNCVVGWCRKAVSARTVRSRFDGFVVGGRTLDELNDLVRQNDLRARYRQAVQCALVHGLSAVTVMRGTDGQPGAKVRVYSANQFCALWDGARDRIKCGVVLHDTDRTGRPTAYVFHFADAVVTTRAVEDPDGDLHWVVESDEPNPMGRPMMELFVHAQEPDHPLGRSLITPELMGIVDKAMRDVLRMDIGAEFFTFPQRYLLGVADDFFGDAEVATAAQKFSAYVGGFLALTRDENGEVPSVGQFSPASADSFTRVFENDAQRFSGATNVPLGQLGVLSNTYTSSDALGAANDPLILEVEQLTDGFREPMAEVGRMMLAVSRGVPTGELGEDGKYLEAYFPDPSMPTIAARADAWTKLGAADPSIVGTPVYYEGVGLSQQTIARLDQQKRQADALTQMGRIADALTGGASNG